MDWGAQTNSSGWARNWGRLFSPSMFLQTSKKSMAMYGSVTWREMWDETWDMIHDYSRAVQTNSNKHEPSQDQLFHESLCWLGLAGCFSKWVKLDHYRSFPTQHFDYAPGPWQGQHRTITQVFGSAPSASESFVSTETRHRLITRFCSTPEDHWAWGHWEPSSPKEG